MPQMFGGPMIPQMYCGMMPQQMFHPPQSQVGEGDTYTSEDELQAFLCSRSRLL